MNFRFFNNFSSTPFLRFLPHISDGEPKPNPVSVAVSPPPPPEQPLPPKHLAFFDLKHLMSSLQSLIPQRHVRPPPPPSLAASAAWRFESGCSLPLFRPYVAKVPWHGGVRAFLSLLFPRYGHYCGPNWSSGKDGGSLLWDRRPIDWLDFCCYCHDIGYDTYDQAKLLKADLTFLECLEKPRMTDKGDARVALLYRSMCIAGLRTLLIPYRMQLVKLQLQEWPSVVDLMGNLISKNSTSKQS